MRGAGSFRQPFFISLFPFFKSGYQLFNSPLKCKNARFRALSHTTIVLKGGGGSLVRRGCFNNFCFVFGENLVEVQKNQETIFEFCYCGNIVGVNAGN